jgi:hypothetical protein
MALVKINPVRKQVGKKGKKSGSQIGQVLGTVGGLALGAGLAAASPAAGAAAGPGLMSAAAAKGAALGGSLGSTVGGIAGHAIDPGESDTRQVVESRQVQIPAGDEALRAQELLAGLQAANRTPGMGKFTSPLTQGYIQSMINLKKMG